MSTYIQGVTDYIPQIQPFQVDLNFYGNVMQNKQSQYDAAKKKVGDLYGSLLNSPMSRDSNIKRREQFFKVINEDIQKISGLDLSLQQNQDAAMNVFSSFYDDKYMVNDMIKTNQNRLKESDRLKSYFDTYNANTKHHNYNFGFHSMVAVARQIGEVVNKKMQFSEFAKKVLINAKFVQAKTTFKREGENLRLTDIYLQWPPKVKTILLDVRKSLSSTAPPRGKLAFEVL